MSIIRVHKKRGRYLVADAEVFEDKTLSFGARGLMAYLLTKPDNWEVRMKHLISASPARKVAIQRMMKELKKAGYMERHQENDPATGRFITITEVFETKALKNDRDAADIPIKSATTLSNLQENQQSAAETPIYGGTGGTATTKPDHGENGSLKHSETDPAALPSNAYMPPDPSAINNMISVIAGTCKGYANFLLGEQCPFYQAAVTLLENGVTEEQVFAFRQWWKKHGYYAGKPAVATLMSEIENSIGGVKATRATRRTPIVQHAIEDLDLWVKRTIGVDEFRSIHTLTAIQKIGESTLRGINQHNRKSLINRFVEEFEKARVPSER
jgi:hypothetical protein